ncbi:MAG: DUF695 domain-containing protein [Chitinivibrionales bacterium]|nr:DUF695 domain-containing protein [Chitinivibrionales bacterium]
MQKFVRINDTYRAICLFFALLFSFFFSLLVLSDCSGTPKKNSDPLPQTHDEWIELSATYNKKPMTILFNQGLTSVVAHPKLDFQAGITARLNNPQADGSATPQEEAELTHIRNQLNETLCANALSVAACVVTVEGAREFIFYTHDRVSFAKKFNTLKGSLNTHTLTLNIQRDDQWSVYKQFALEKK